MGMGYGGNFSVVIQESDLKKVVPAAFKRFATARADMLDDYEEFAQLVSNDDKMNPEVHGVKEMEAAYAALQAAFKKATGIGLYLNYHSEDDGDRYDDVNGIFWSLSFDDCYPESKQFKTLRKKCKKYAGIHHFVTFG